jgi:hypothetical protein
MAEVFAGAVCGYAIALAVTPLGMIALVRARASVFGDTIPEGARLTVVAIVLHLFSFVVLSIIGIAFGLLLNGLESGRPDSGLGSPNMAFTLLVVAITAIAVVPLAAVSQRLRMPLLASGVLFAGVFGWAMPHLAALA